MLRTRPSTRALHEDRESKEDAVVEESSPRTKTKKTRRALGDVSNNNARNGTALDGDKRMTMVDVEKQSLRRSRRLSTISYTNEDRNPTDEEEGKIELPPIIPPTFIEKREKDSDTNVTEIEDGNAVSKSTTGDEIDNAKAAATSTNRNTNRSKKRVNGGSFDIEAALLEPRPKRNRTKAKKNARIQQRTDASMKEKKDVEENGSKVQTPVAGLSEMPSSTIALNSSSHRRLDSSTSSDDDHCLPRRLEGPFDASKFTTGIATFDKASEGNVGEVPAYVTDIFQRLFDAERVTRPSPSYIMDEQDEINSTMRAILVDWLVGVQMKFRLQPETLYLCVNIIDRYLSKARVRRRRLQLLGITSLFVACKYEEIYPLEVKDCVYVTDRAYNRQQVLDMEFEIVMVLGFKMTVPTAYPFLQRFLHITNAPKMIRDLASFYTERMLQEYCMLNFRASLVASAAVFLAWNNPTAIEKIEDTAVVHELPKVLDTIVNYTGFCEKQIRHTAMVICRKIQPPSNTGQKGRPTMQLEKVHMKYRYEDYSKVSYFGLPDNNLFVDV